MTEGLDPRRKRIIYRATHRGTKESDLIIGGWIAAALPAIPDFRLGEVEELLEELDLEEPESPILIHGAIRSKKPGATDRAKRDQTRQSTWQRGLPDRNAEIDKLLDEAWDREHRKQG